MKLSLLSPPLSNAAPLAKLAAAAYSDDPTSHDKWESLGLTQLKTFASPKKDTRGFAAMDDENIIVAFRGTDDVKDMITDINILTVRGYGGRVHKGFADALQSIWPDVCRDILALQSLPTVAGKPVKRTVWFTGHSLGGALAVLAGQRAVAEQLVSPGTVGVFTYGQPRVGDEEFAKHYPANLCRFVFRNDLVPAVPPKELSALFTHVGETLWLSGNRRKILENKPTDWTSFVVRCAVSQMLQMVRDPDRRLWLSYLSGFILVGQGVRDHGLKHYIRELEKLQSQTLTPR